MYVISLSVSNVKSLNEICRDVFSIFMIKIEGLIIYSVDWVNMRVVSHPYVWFSKLQIGI